MRLSPGIAQDSSLALALHEGRHRERAGPELCPGFGPVPQAEDEGPHGAAVGCAQQAAAALEHLSLQGFGQGVIDLEQQSTELELCIQ